MEILLIVGLCCIVLGLCQRKKPREDTIEEQIASLRRKEPYRPAGTRTRASDL